ncbi:MAG: ABC transporter substrate-binding protein [Oscillospiraceae bacterium]|nr:ABC transporter substrate-binding protein [Oscillospiraceae bacterium]
MKTLKKVVVLCVVLALVVSAFAGCGNTSTGTSAGTAAAGDTIKIGGTGPLTGGAATYGNSVKNGATIAVEEINAAGGINGVMLELMFEDDEADGAKAKSAYEKLMDKGMQMMMGAVTSGASVALNDLVKADGILQVTPSASQAEAAENANAFRVCFTDPLQGTEMAKYAYNTLKYTKVAVIYNQDDTYSTGMCDAFKAEWTALGGEIVVDTSFSKDATDFSAQISKVAESNADFVFLPIYAEKAAQIAIEANNQKMTLPLIGGDGIDGILSYLEGDNAKLVEGMIYLTPFVASDSNADVQKFVAAYKAAYNAEPDQFAADAYDAIYCMKAAMEKCDVKAASDINNEALVAAMHEIEVVGLTGTMTFDENGDANKGAKVAKIVDGNYVAQ